MPSDNFAAKLKTVLKVLVISRTGLASELNVDKSLVSRWAAGTVTPSEHNKVKITRFVAQHVPDFTLLDWERDLESLKSLLGVTKSGEVIKDAGSDLSRGILPQSFLEESQRNVARRGNEYTGLWKTTRASHDLPGKFIHDICMVRKTPDGRLKFKTGVEGVRYEGWSFLLQHQLFSISYDHSASTMLFSIFNGVARQRPEVIDGVNLATLRDAGGSPAASACILNRIADLTGDEQKDEDMFEAAVAELNPLAEDGSVPADVAAHLTKTVSDGALGFIRVLYSDTMARGSILGELD